MKRKILTIITIGSIFCMALTGCGDSSGSRTRSDRSTRSDRATKSDRATADEAERPDDSEAERESKEELETIIENLIVRKAGSHQSDETFLLPDDVVEYNGHHYYLYSDICNTWEEAKTYCESVGGYLAIIDDDAENTFLYDLMKEAGHKNAYFGLSDCETEGVWKYVDGSDPEYTNWSNGEPNNERGVEHYAMFYYKSPEYQWNDGDFNHGTINDNANFICEWDQ